MSTGRGGDRRTFWSRPGRAVTRADLLLFAGLALLLTWPLAAVAGDRLIAPEGPGDPYLNLWILGWDLRAITSDPAALINGRIFNANIFHPAELTLAYSDHLLLQAVALTPLYALTGNLALCYNLLFLGSILASALAMQVFAFAVTGSRWGGRVAALAWAFLPFRFAHLLHVQLHGLYFLPLSLLFVHRLIARRRRADAVALGLMAGLNAASSVYIGVIGAVGLATSALVAGVTAGGRHRLVLVRRFLLAALVGACLLAPLIWPYARVQVREGFGRNLYEASQHAAVLGSYVRVPPGNLLYGRTGLLRPSSSTVPARGEGPEHELFPGFVLSGLAAIGLWRARRRDSWPVAASLAAVAMVGIVLSLGPDGVRPVYAAAHRVVFGFEAIRAPARFGVLVTLALAGLAALGLREIAEGWTPGRRAVEGGRPFAAAALVALVALEYINVPLPAVTAPPRATEIGAWLKKEPGLGAAVYLPIEDGAGSTEAMVRSLEHGRPIVNGYSGQRPSFYAALVDVLNRFPSAEALWTLRDLDVRFVVTREPAAIDRLDGHTAGEAGRDRPRPSPVVERVRFASGVIYELRWTPEMDAWLPRPDTPPPPEPGALPIGAREELVYRVVWLSRSDVLALSAGEIRVHAARIRQADSGASWPDGAAYRFTVDARTAPWVARFFEADDRFTTLADRRLLPLVAEQRLREGPRRVDRTSSFDHASGRVHLGGGVTLPLARDARDPITALFYARTLDLAEGTTYRIPLSEGGRPLEVVLRVAGREAIDLGGQRVDALRLEPSVVARIERRRPISATLWMSLDGLRRPLALDVSAGFGSFRAELTSASDR